MEKTFYTSAPEILHTGDVYPLWNKKYPGGLRTFTAFMTTPSEEREAFLAEISDRISSRRVCEGVATIEIV